MDEMEDGRPARKWKKLLNKMEDLLEMEEDGR